jgi:hypothetical protein
MQCPLLDLLCAGGDNGLQRGISLLSLFLSLLFLVPVCLFRSLPSHAPILMCVVGDVPGPELRARSRQQR